MIKKVILAGALCVAPVLAQAGTGAGCGLGAMLFKDKSGTVSHVLAATTNGTLGNQTFGMTSGTLGCDVSKPIQFMAYDFLNSNMNKVARDMATGSGESLNTLAGLLGVAEQDRATFIKVSQENFTSIFNSNEIKSGEVYDSIIAMMEDHAVLSQYVA